MGLRQRKRPASEAVSVHSEASLASKGSKGSSNGSKKTLSEEEGSTSHKAIVGNEVEQLMGDNLDLMYDIVMRIREDKDFASNIYAECPRLQFLLDQHPDLRPIFEDPYLVRINFEKVYRDAGGVLPDDIPPKKGILATIVSHPCFKLFRFLLIIKKIINCIMGSGAAAFRSLATALCFDDVSDLAHAVDDTDLHDDTDHNHETSLENQENRETLNRAADHMEDPEVQERIQDILNTDDPAALEEAIENDPELRALRDSNPLCAELMSDPETMKILVDPDNLRALGECPDLIEQDFANPDWSPPDVEAGQMEDTGNQRGLNTIGEAEFEGGDVESELGVDVDDHGPETGAGDEDLEGGVDATGNETRGDDKGVEYDDLEFEMGDEDLAEKRDRPDVVQSKSRSASKATNNKMKQRSKENRGNFFRNVGAALTDIIAAGLVEGAADVAGAGDLSSFDDPTPNAGHADNMVTRAEVLADSNTAEALEAGTDNMKERHEDQVQDKQKGKSAVASSAANLDGGASTAARKSQEVEESEELNDDASSKKEKISVKKGRFAYVGNFLGAVSTAAKEMVAGELLGDDFGEDLVERMEKEDNREKDDGEKKKKIEESKEGANEDERKSKGEEDKKEKRGFFRLKKRKLVA